MRNTPRPSAATHLQTVATTSRKALWLSTVWTVLNLFHPHAAGQSTFTTASGSQSWGTASNWTPSGVPNAVGASAIILTPVGGNQAINSFGVARTLGSLSITNDSTNTFSITTSNTLNLDATTGNASLSVAGAGDVVNTFGGNLNVVLLDSVDLSVTNTTTTSADGALRINGEISGAGRINKLGAGTVTLTGTNTYTGGVSIVEGTLRITVGAGLGANPASYVADQIVLNGGTLAYGSTTGSFNSAANRGFSLGNAGGTFSIPSAGATFTVSAIIADLPGETGAFTKTGNGTLNLNAASTYSGGTTIASGTLQVGVGGSLGSASSTVTLGSAGGGNASLISYLAGYSYAQDIQVAAGSGGTLTLGYTSTASFSAHFTGDISLNDALTLRSESAEGFAMRLSGDISGPHNLTKTGVGTIRIEGDNSGYTGTTTLSNGTVQLGSFAGSANGDLGSGPIINNATLRINRTNAFALANVMSGSGALVHTGSGTTTLSADNSYTGGTSVTNGRLMVTNATGSATGSGPFTTAAGTVLGGTGRIILADANSATLSGQVAPGLTGVNDGVGTLTIGSENGQVTFQTGSSIAFELRADGDNDQLSFTSTGAGLMDFSALAPGSLSVAFTGGYTPDLDHRFDLLDWSALTGPGVTGLSTSLLNLPTTGFDANWAWDTSLFTSSGVIFISLVPEPSRLAFVALGLLSLITRRRLR
ncbi:autotransporter-associated beta strand repeat-containing protein [Prosthecobacter sp. SYSU 5D2]|uniref:autotransporter-associated beta strand repeat-containing protein n=1 Tax=Prosthecobacter sp. SYSU 5D2 TaxID=3134134 RepID=UPI0031FEAFA4